MLKSSRSHLASAGILTSSSLGGGDFSVGKQDSPESIRVTILFIPLGHAQDSLPRASVLSASERHCIFMSNVRVENMYLPDA